MYVDTHREERHCLMKFSLEVLAKREINNVYWSSKVGRLSNDREEAELNNHEETLKENAFNWPGWPHFSPLLVRHVCVDVIYDSGSD